MVLISWCWRVTATWPEHLIQALGTLAWGGQEHPGAQQAETRTWLWRKAPADGRSWRERRAGAPSAALLLLLREPPTGRGCG